MRPTARQYAAVLHEALGKAAPSDQDAILDRFAKLLSENRDLKLFPEIEKEYENYDRESKGIKLAEMTVAHKLTQEEEKKIIHQLNDYVKGQVELKQKIDEGIVGGFVVRIEDALIDGSVKKNLSDLKEELSK